LCISTSFSAFDPSSDKIYPVTNESSAVISPAARIYRIDVDTYLYFSVIEKNERKRTVINIPIGRWTNTGCSLPMVVIRSIQFISKG
jgi:hypothetical protein